MRVPFLMLGTKTNSKSIHLIWGELTSPGNGGDSSQLDYRVYWATNDFNSQWQILVYHTSGATQIETKTYTGEQLSSTKQYKFMVQAYNDYGDGPTSTVLYATIEGSQTGAKMGAGAALSSIMTALISFCT